MFDSLQLRLRLLLLLPLLRIDTSVGEHLKHLISGPLQVVVRWAGSLMGSQVSRYEGLKRKLHHDEDDDDDLLDFF